MKQRHKKQTTRTAVNGLAMTSLDFILFTSLASWLSWSPVLINGLSTGTTSLASYVINKHWVFSGQKDDMSTGRQLGLFVLVTLVGLFVVQGLIIWLITQPGGWLGGRLDQLIQSLGLGDYPATALTLGLAKLAAVAAGSIWNFFVYKYLVFGADSGKSAG